MPYILERPASEADWRAFHDIREAELFVAFGRVGVYDRDHPDDRQAENTPLLLKLDGRPIGVARLDDLGDGAGAVRLVAITAAEQRRGHGRELSALCDARARQAGWHTLCVNAAPDAVGFYERMGWQRHVWDPAELAGIAEECIQMRKRL